MEALTRRVAVSAMYGKKRKDLGLGRIKIQNHNLIKSGVFTFFTMFKFSVASYNCSGHIELCFLIEKAVVMQFL